MKTSLADRVRILLELSEVKAREASRLAGYSSEAYVGMLLRGDVTDPRTNSIEPLATAFGCSPGWLAFGSGEAPTQDAVREAVERARATARPVGADHTASDFTVESAPRPSHPEAA